MVKRWNYEYSDVHRGTALYFGVDALSPLTVADMRSHYVNVSLFRGCLDNQFWDLRNRALRSPLGPPGAAKHRRDV